jgi:MinD-like ATPase involved in chromosome partitioning or flagellar assembly
VVLENPETPAAKAINELAEQLAQVKLELKGKRLPVL